MKKYLFNQWLVFSLVSSQLLLMGSVNAEIFKCTNSSGKVYYNDRPCPVEDDEKKIKSEKDIENGYVPPAFAKQQEQARRKGVVVGGVLSNGFEAKDNTEGETEEKDTDNDKEGKDRGSKSSSNSLSQEGRDQTGHSGRGGDLKLPPLKGSSFSDQGNGKGSKSKLTLKQKKEMLNIRMPHR